MHADREKFASVDVKISNVYCVQCVGFLTSLIWRAQDNYPRMDVTVLDLSPYYLQARNPKLKLPVHSSFSLAS
jgi:hypothetical protein